MKEGGGGEGGEGSKVSTMGCRWKNTDSEVSNTYINYFLLHWHITHSLLSLSHHSKLRVTTMTQLLY